MFGLAGTNAEPELYGSPKPSTYVSPFASDEELCENLLQKAEEVIGGKFDIAREKKMNQDNRGRDSYQTKIIWSKFLETKNTETICDFDSRTLLLRS